MQLPERNYYLAPAPHEQMTLALTTALIEEFEVYDFLAPGEGNQKVIEYFQHQLAQGKTSETVTYDHPLSYWRLADGTTLLDNVQGLVSVHAGWVNKRTHPRGWVIRAANLLDLQSYTVPPVHAVVATPDETVDG